MLAIGLCLIVAGWPTARIPAQTSTLPSASNPKDTAPADRSGYELVYPALGTRVVLRAYHHDRQLVARAFQAAQERTSQLNQILTDYDADSETRQLTDSAVDRAQTVSTDLWAVLAASDRWYRHSAGAFDSSLGSVTRLWRKYRRVRRPPPAELIQTRLQHSGWSHVHLDDKNQTVRFDIDGLGLDFGGIGKGYIVDQVFQVLQDHQLSCCLVNISGNMRLGFAPPDQAGWRIQISKLAQDGQPLRIIEVAETAIATSGDLWQFMMLDGRRRSHILDPRSGIGVLGPVAATALAETATDADALATSACVMAPDKALRLADSLGLQLLIARRDDQNQIRLRTTSGFPADQSAVDGHD